MNSGKTYQREGKGGEKGKGRGKNRNKKEKMELRKGRSTGEQRQVRGGGRFIAKRRKR